MPHQILFLPGAGGSGDFWRPAVDHLPHGWRTTLLAWPGLGNEPHDPTVRGVDDLVALAERHIDGPTVVAAQSMGGIVAVRLALRRPDLVRALVLTVTSGGVDLDHHAPADWRADYRHTFPHAAEWITHVRPDHTPDFGRIRAPVLLIWGDADPISPVSVGEELESLLPRARLHVIAGGTHDLARDAAPVVAALIERFVEELTLGEEPIEDRGQHAPS